MNKYALYLIPLLILAAVPAAAEDDGLFEFLHEIAKGTAGAAGGTIQATGQLGQSGVGAIGDVAGMTGHVTTETAAAIWQASEDIIERGFGGEVDPKEGMDEDKNKHE